MYDLTLGDIVRMDKGWIPFEKNEPMYLKAMYGAFQEIVNNTDNELDVSLIKQLHKLSANEVKYTGYYNSTENKIGEFRVTDTGAFTQILTAFF